MQTPNPNLAFNFSDAPWVSPTRFDALRKALADALDGQGPSWSPRQVADAFTAKGFPLMVRHQESPAEFVQRAFESLTQKSLMPIYDLFADLELALLDAPQPLRAYLRECRDTCETIRSGHLGLALLARARNRHNPAPGLDEMIGELMWDEGVAVTGESNSAESFEACDEQPPEARPGDEPSAPSAPKASASDATSTSAATAESLNLADQKPKPFFTANQLAVLDNCERMGRRFFTNGEDAPLINSLIKLRLFPLIAGPTGVGKSFLVKALAERLGASYLRLTRSGWTVRNARNDLSTLLQVLVALANAEGRLILHIDELDKFSLNFSQEWSASIGGDLWDLLERDLNVEELVKSAPANTFPTARPDIKRLSQRLRTDLWIVGSGTWQNLFAESESNPRKMGFDCAAPPPTSAKDSDFRESLLRQEAISTELMARFNSDVQVLTYPGRAETATIMASMGLPALARRAGMTVTPADIDWKQGGMRVLETLVTRFTLKADMREANARAEITGNHNDSYPAK